MTTCSRPPVGWRCSLDEGHDGPCPAVPVRSIAAAPAWRVGELRASLATLDPGARLYVLTSDAEGAIARPVDGIVEHAPGMVVLLLAPSGRPAL